MFAINFYILNMYFKHLSNALLDFEKKKIYKNTIKILKCEKIDICWL